MLRGLVAAKTCSPSSASISSPIPRRYADIVLPATTQLEQFDLMFSWGHLYLTLNEPAIAPRGEAVAEHRTVPAAGRAPWASTIPTGSARTKRWPWTRWTGKTRCSKASTSTACARPDTRRLKVGSPDDFVPHREGNFPTPSGKVEFKSSMAAGGNMVLPLFRQGYLAEQSGEPLDPLPDFVPQNESPDTNPSRSRPATRST